ncbi:cytidylate kinase [Dethiosulfatibacter aminovorans DSM 17477]|uniref:Cytidylate kinase n=1 Tax=Dethiosulfatibacter aminovorans DSM 17477 TaxID=1121476 RepID=A0A1M6DB89_9FIRM|nr:(d)CMP kinase [Dethiosulfatibacter aminovorans]SHI70425.1 cytidylate kinase [Dethiosulfatibacter aminovorans DSM 17477]
MIIAIDGPAGAGKSTIAKKLSKQMGYMYLDTGAIYRTITLDLCNRHIDVENKELLAESLSEIDMEYTTDHIFLNGKIVDDEIRTESISQKTSHYSSKSEIRVFAVEMQRNISLNEDIVLEGRDIGTVVFPNADYKFYLTASEEERGKRRYKDMIDKGMDTTLEEIVDSIKKRDFNDKNREIAPLSKADDAIEIDTTSMTIDEVVEKMVNCIKGGVSAL